MNLEFTASGAFRARIAGHPGLLVAVKQWHREHPSSIQGLASCELSYQGQTLAIIYRRRENRIGLVEIFTLPGEEALFRLRLKDLLSQYLPASKEGS